ncbi:hypothetical protein HW555_013553 [Spodoptera exigua]|uniref:Uncharacterized protein n=1 Tax=Spodoptera exigua TaxID=7107 RepID=A0A835KY15_SPOEX|nr:hypothetical protein HW555_013553 [Spodoptera exigua]
MICCRVKGQVVSPHMGNLLQQHLNLGGYQIETEGVDYAGPVFSASRQVCGCRLTKVINAVHNKLVDNSTSNNFLSALRRPKHNYFDNGTSFVGAYNVDTELTSTHTTIIGPHDLLPLTPRQFLIGRPLKALPTPSYEGCSKTHLTRYLRIEVRIGDTTASKMEVMFYTDQDFKALHPVQDEISLNDIVADIRTTDGVVRRAFSKICPLPALLNIEGTSKDSSSNGINQVIMSKGWILEHNEEDAAQNRVTLTKGDTSDDNILLYQQTCYVPAIPYDFVRCDVVYRGEPNEKIYRISTSSYWPSPSHIYVDGLLTNVGRVRMVSKRGERLYSTVKMYGKIIEDNSES